MYNTSIALSIHINVALVVLLAKHQEATSKPKKNSQETCFSFLCVLHKIKISLTALLVRHFIGRFES